jgi:hypothetical protein
VHLALAGISLMPTLLERRGPNLRLQVMLNGKAKSPVSVFDESTSSPQQLACYEIDLGNPRDRTALLEAVSADYRDEISQLASEAVHEIARYRTKPSGNEKVAESPFAVIEPWNDDVVGEELLDDLSALIERYMVLPAHTTEPIALWILHTYLLDVADYTPYLHVSSPTRECGKSTLLDLLQRLAFRGMLTSGITAAALYRRIDRHRPAMLLDEMDTRLKGEHAEILRGVLNSGFYREGRFTICVGDAHEERDFKTFAPKVLAGIGRLPDTITSRSIPIRLSRASKDELKRLQKIQGHKIAALCEPYRRRLLRWANDHRVELLDADPEVPAELGARQADVWRPILAIADLVASEWPLKARSAALALHSVAEQEGDYGLLLLSDLRDLFRTDDTENLLTSRIVAAFSKMETRPWAEYRGDRPITPRGISSLLGRFGIKPTTVRVGAEVGKGYRIQDVAREFKRYLPDVTDVTDSSAQREPGWEPEQS